MEKVTWEYYNSHFPKLTEEEFVKLEYRASKLVSKKINKKYLNSQDEDDVKDCICNVVNMLSVVDNQMGKSSVSNDGYSESYISSDQLNNSINKVINDWIGTLVNVYQGF